MKQQLTRIVAITLITGLAACGGSTDAQSSRSAAPTAVKEQDPAGGAHPHTFFAPSEMRWQDGPPSLPEGAQFVVLEGDITRPEPFSMRVRVPDGYLVPPHSHPSLEHATVISGKWNIGMGNVVDRGKATALPAGSFAYLPGGTQHFAFAEADTVIQLHGIGPWGITYVYPSDDPRSGGS